MTHSYVDGLMLVRKGTLVDSNLFARVTLLPKRQYLAWPMSKHNKRSESIAKSKDLTKSKFTLASCVRRRQPRPSPYAVRCASWRFDAAKTRNWENKKMSIRFRAKLVNQALSRPSAAFAIVGRVSSKSRYKTNWLIDKNWNDCSPPPPPVGTLLRHVPVTRKKREGGKWINNKRPLTWMGCPSWVWWNRHTSSMQSAIQAICCAWVELARCRPPAAQ